jgi:uncharacterized protein YkwD
MAQRPGLLGWRKWLHVTVLSWLAALFAVLAPGTAQSAGVVSITVTLPDGSPAANATIFLNDQRVLAGPDGQWQGSLPSSGRLYEAAALPGFASRGVRWSDVASSSSGVPTTLVLKDQLVSVFDVSTDTYLPGRTPPLIAQFVTNTGLSEQQEVPAETTSVSVSGGVGEADGHPFVRGDGWLAEPDDSVTFVPVALQGDTFTATFPFDQGPGHYQIEINDTTGGAVINVPIFVGVPYAPDAPIWPPVDNPAPADSAHQALEALNQLRSPHGLSALPVDPRLEAIAQDHVADLVAHQWYCHCWADGTSILDHVRAASIGVAMRPSLTGPRGSLQYGIGEGFASLEGAAAIQQLFTSPSHRHDLLGDWTNVGIASSPDPSLPVVVIEYAAEQ